MAMTRADILQKITETLAVVTDDPDLKLTEATTAEDVAEWDSVNHVKLIVALENDLHIRFEPDEITEMANVGALIDLIEQKL
jgi:acyl carrier protein